MAKHVEPDQILVKMPSLRAVKSFVAAAKYLNFTRAAESLCVTQAAISRQIRELEASLGVPLFKRVGRAVELTEAGTIFYDAAFLSFVNIAQAAQRIQHMGQAKPELSICCTPAFSAFWLTNRLPTFLNLYPDININVVSTSSLLSTEPGFHPDVFISKVNTQKDGYHSEPLFHDLIYPVCSPDYLAQNKKIVSIDGLTKARLLNLTPYGRSQVAEHVDWEVWLRSFGVEEGVLQHLNNFNANDYNMLIQLACEHQGVCLGWHHLVAPLIKKGVLVKVGEKELVFKEKRHFLTYSERSENNPAFVQFKAWFMDDLAQELATIA